MNEICSVDDFIIQLSDTKLVEVLPYGNPSASSMKNSKILNDSITYISKSERLKESLFLGWKFGKWLHRW